MLSLIKNDPRYMIKYQKTATIKVAALTAVRCIIIKCLGAFFTLFIADGNTSFMPTCYFG